MPLLDPHYQHSSRWEREHTHLFVSTGSKPPYEAPAGRKIPTSELVAHIPISLAFLNQTLFIALHRIIED